MKTELECQIELIDFSCTEFAKEYALARGVEQNFFEPDENALYCSSPVIFGCGKNLELNSLAVYYPRSYEVGLWVKEEDRFKGVGSELFSAFTEKLINSRKVCRIYARVDRVNNNHANAMRRILKRFGFEVFPIYSSGVHQELWLKNI